MILSLSNAHLGELLFDLADHLEVSYFDVREVIPTHETKTYRVRVPSEIESSCYHHQAADPKPHPSWLPTGDPGVIGVLQANGSLILDDSYIKAVFGIAEYHSGPKSHLSKGGAPGIAYTLVVDPEGGIYFCNDIESRTWSQGDNDTPGDENDLYLAVLFMGDMVSEHNTKGHAPTAKQMMVATALWPRVFERLGLNPARATTHNRLGKAACPGDHLTAVVESVRASADPSGDIDLGTWLGRQVALNKAGANPRLTEDGIPGARSKNAVKEFQRSQGLAADGVWGKRTEAAMLKALDSL